MQENILSKQLSLGLNFSTPSGGVTSPSLKGSMVKVYERVIRKHMVHYLETNNLLTDKQHGFRLNRSCLTQMLNHFDDIFEGFTRGEDTDSIYLDYAKAFDKVDLDLVDWIQPFLSDCE